MKSLTRAIKCLSLLMAWGWTAPLSGQNQTSTLSPIFPEYDVPFRIQIEQADFSMPNGIHSYAAAEYDSKWLFLAGRTNGLHGFSSTNTNFPPQQQNDVVYVVDPINKTVASRSLNDPGSGLTQKQIDLLSVTSPQAYQSNATLYMTGGYGYVSSNGNFTTKDALTAIDIPGLMNWVSNASTGETAAQHIRQISNPAFQVTGGYMNQIGNNPTLLVFGQNFTGFYSDNSNGNYTQQVRRFYIIDDGSTLAANILPPSPLDQDPNLRRRDLNVVPVISNENGQLTEGLVALSGVFTLDTGVWTVPVEINAQGVPSMADPSLPGTFKQGMNNYVSPTLGLYSEKTGDMYTTLLGGISFGYFDENGEFKTDSEIPFINEVTTVGIDQDGNYTQYLMSGEYPVILSTQTNPGNRLLFGAGGDLMTAEGIPLYSNGVLNLDALPNEPVAAGYIVGGIQSTLHNTNTRADSAASPYIFTVTVLPVPVITDGQVVDVSDNNLGSVAGAVIFDKGTLRTLASVNSSDTLVFRSGGGTFDTNGFNSTLSGIFWGPGPFIKTGQGQLALAGDQSGYTGVVRVEEGILKITPSAILGNILNVGPAGELTGTGVLNNVANSGIVYPGDNPGTLFIDGNYVQNESGILLVGIDSSSNSLLEIYGNASLKGSLQTTLFVGYTPALGDSFTILNAGSISGQFSSLRTNVTPTTLFEPTYSSESIKITFVRDYLNINLASSLSRNERAVGAMLNRVAPAATGDLNTVLNAIDALATKEQVAEAFDQLTPRTAEVQSSLAFAEATLQNRNLIRRMALLRQGCRGMDVSGFCIETAEGCFSSCCGPSCFCDCDRSDRWGVFLTGKAIFTDQKRTEHQDSYDSTTTGITGGADYALNDNLTAGVTAGYNHSHAHLDHRGGKLRDDFWNAGVYATYGACGFFADALFTYGWNKYRITRKIEFPGIDRKAKSRPDGRQYDLYADLGYEIDACGWILEPAIALQYVHLHLDGYREKDADSLDLRVHKQNARSLQGSIGATFNRQCDISCTRTLTTLRAFYVHEFEDKSRDVKARLAKTPESVFHIHTGTPGKDFAILGAGFSALISDCAMVFLDYDAEVGRRHYFAQSVNGGIRVEF